MTKIKRNIVHIDEDKCNGCGACIPSCKEGALQIVDGKAKLVKEIYCDGLGACLGDCPQGAITIEEREADAFDEAAVEEHLKETKKASPPPLACGCPGTMAKSLKKDTCPKPTGTRQNSELQNWPVQLMLVPPNAPYLQGADIVFLADCTGFAYANIHQDFIRNRVAIIACPKLDDQEVYIQKLTQMIEINNFRTIEVVMMEVPCCNGLGQLLEKAITQAKTDIQLKKTIISVEGEVLNKG